MRRMIGLLFKVFVVIVTLGVAETGSSDIPRKVTYQGRPVDSVTGQPMPDPHDMTFRLYIGAEGGTILWGESQTANADSAGVFSVVLGSIVPIGLRFTDPVWLEVEVDGEPLSPRREIASVPFAFRALHADSPRP